MTTLSTFPRLLLLFVLAFSFAACDSGGDGDGNSSDTTAPTLISASSNDGTMVTATFDEALDPTSVTASAFTVTPGASVASASSNGAQVTLVLAAGLDDDDRQTYTVTANGVRDTAGNTATGTSATFSYGGSSGSASQEIGAAYPNAGDSRVVLFNADGDRLLLFNPVTGAVTDADDVDDVENGLIPLDAVGASANVFGEDETYFFSTDGDTFTNYERDVADFDTPASFEEEYDEQGYDLNSIGAAFEGDFFASNSIVLFNQNGTEWQLWQPEFDSFSDVLTFPAQFGGGNAPISAVGAAFYREEENQVYLFNRDGSQYTIWSGGSSFTAAFDISELGNIEF